MPGEGRAQEGVTGPQALALGVAGLVLLVAAAYALVPFRLAGAVTCGPALLGSKPRSDTDVVGLLRPGPDCRARGNSRRITAGVVALAAVVVGVTALVLPPGRGEGTSTEPSAGA